MRWQLTLREPSDEMCAAGMGWREWDRDRPAISRAYEAALAATPDPTEDDELVEHVMRAVSVATLQMPEESDARTIIRSHRMRIARAAIAALKG